MYRLLHLLRSEKKDITSIYFYAILSGLVQLSVPLGIQAIIGFVLGATMVTSIFILILLVVIGVSLVGVFQINQMKIIEKIQQNIFSKNAFEFAEKIPRLDLKKIDRNYLPETVNRFFDTINIQKGLSKILLDIPISTIQILFGLLLLCFYHPIFIAFGLILIAILWLILKVTSKKGIESSLKESSYKYNVVAWFEEMGRVIKSFKFSQGSHLNLQRTDKNLLGYLNARTVHFKVLLVQYKALVFFKVAVTVAMLTVGTYLLLNQQLNIGEFIAAEIVILTIIGAVEKLIGSIENVYDVITGLEKIATVTETIEEKSGNIKLETENKGMEFTFINFNFGFEPNQLVLKNLNLTIKPNSINIVRGQEGSGKSSFIKVLTGNYNEFDGALLLNNIPLNNYSLESLRNNIGIYLNDQDVFKGTVWENISMGKSNITPDTILATAKKIGIENFLENLKDGFETIFDPSGKNISSSLIKKILLLRAFVNNPKLLLLEEPWLGLPESNKEKILSYLASISSTTTIVIVTNDQDIIQLSNNEITIENGFAHLNKIK
jgi:ATP-binding cassette, subfamily B, bacterial